MASQPLQDGEKYDVLEVIGRGSFGIIRKVRRKNDGHILCRKEIAYQKMAAKEREQLAAEFNILSSLNHMNIVQYYHREHLKTTQELYIYMEYCGGGDLGGVIKGLKSSGEYATEEFVWRIFAQIVEALYRCHYGVDAPEAGSDLGRATRELKRQQAMGPVRVFLGEDQSVKLGDFGLSKLMQSHDFASTYVGTPFYMSPEICAAERYTSHSDIWSLGCIMYELCTREPPFNAKTHLQLVQRIRKGDFKELPDCYSKDLKNVIASCLKVNPLHRPDTASLLTVPYVWIARKGKEMVDFGKVLKTKEELAIQKLRQAEERLAAIEADRAQMREEIEATVRREWEVKARLEIDKQISAGLEKLRRKFDSEVEDRVRSIVGKQHTQGRSIEQRALQDIQNPPPSVKENQEPNHHSSISASGEDDFPSTTDITDLSSLSLESPASSTTKPPTKKSSKTPFARSKTTFESPADVQMNEASPMSISGLALSPRRNANAAAQAAANAGSRNIFTEASAKQKVAAAKWEPTLAYNSDSDDEDGFPDLPSPTRPKSNHADPFKVPTRPGLMRGATTTTMQKLNAQPTLFPAASNKGTAIRTAVIGGQQGNLPNSHTLPDLRAESTVGTLRKSPHRRLSKIPSSTALAAVSEAGSPTRLPSKQQASFATRAAEAEKQGTTQRNNIGGRTLVELAQARAGGRPLSMEVKPSTSVKIAAAVTANHEIPVWDPERDEMPSPFLVRGTKIIRGLR
ncbi:putative g2-specific protein kinase [Phaeomoniella chlamydospora]|uniref:non-specific serine/threonine protein kinase n=1 Tax=Phaeomoniella chlamydospora TaxID=158046 RepID=A0A0G2GAY4_PHACM|nr:putative g2-specific protein kinase [Phaeomoniella chlamydospora]